MNASPWGGGLSPGAGRVLLSLAAGLLGVAFLLACACASAQGRYSIQLKNGVASYGYIAAESSHCARLAQAYAQIQSGRLVSCSSDPAIVGSTLTISGGTTPITVGTITDLGYGLTVTVGANVVATVGGLASVVTIGANVMPVALSSSSSGGMLITTGSAVTAVVQPSVLSGGALVVDLASAAGNFGTVLLSTLVTIAFVLASFLGFIFGRLGHKK